MADQEKKAKKIFWAISKSHPEEKEMQGILYADGTVEIGFDAWRILNKHDINSYPVYEYKSMSRLSMEYTIRNRVKGYYLPQKEEKWNMMLTS